MTTVDCATERGGPAMPALRMRRLLLALVVLIGCNVVRLRERALHRHASAAGLREADVTVGDTRVHVWHREGAAPLLLLHGFGASALWQWDEIVLAFLDRDHAIATPVRVGRSARKRRRLMPSRKKSGLPYATASAGMIASAKADSQLSHSSAAALAMPSTRVMLATKSASGQRRWNPDHSHMRQRRSLGGTCRSHRRASQRGHNPTISPAQ